MTERIIGPTGSRRRKRWALLGPLALALALFLPTILWASALPPSGSTNQFEFDGNLKVEAAQPGNLDWAPGDAGTAVIKDVARSIPTGNDTSSCTATSGSSSLYVPGPPVPANQSPPLAPFVLGNGSTGQGVLVCDGTISKQTPNDANGYVQGAHEDEGTNPVHWNVAPASSPKKTDLSEVYTYGMTFDSPFDGDLLHNNLLMVFDAGRLDTNGDFHVDFEMNQKHENDCGDAVVKTVCQPRTVGDTLVSYDSNGGNSPPTATVFKWEHPPTDGPCASSMGTDSSPTDGGCYVLLTTPPAQGGFQAAAGVFNTSEIDAAPWNAVVCDPTSIQSSTQCTLRSKIPAGGNMEGYIDITGFVPDFNLCPGFGQITARSRSSSGINASLQDTTGAIPVNASICGSIIVKKEDPAGNALPGAKFTFSPDFLTGTAGSSTEVTDGVSPDAADGDNGYVCVDHVLFGSYDITETGVPAGYFGDSSPKTVGVTDPSTCADRLDDDGVPLDANDVDATFTNNLGSILIKKLKRNADGTTGLVGGATFTVSPDPTVGQTGGSKDITDDGTGDQSAAAGIVCIDNVQNLGTGNDYTVTEKTPPSGFFGDSNSITVGVHSASKCADRLDAGGLPTGSVDATFTNIKASLLIRKEAKDHSAPNSTALFSGATFTITPSPLTGTGSLDVTDGGAGDANATGGLICIDDVVNLGAGNSYSIVEKNANNVNYTKDTSTKTVANSALNKTLCSARTTTAGNEDAGFTNTPLSQLEVIFTSSAGAGVTAATINDCNGGATQTAFSDSTFGSLPPGTYQCTIVIDP